MKRKMLGFAFPWFKVCFLGYIQFVFLFQFHAFIYKRKFFANWLVLQCPLNTARISHIFSSTASRKGFFCHIYCFWGLGEWKTHYLSCLTEQRSDRIIPSHKNLIIKSENWTHRKTHYKDNEKCTRSMQYVLNGTSCSGTHCCTNYTLVFHPALV